MSQGHSITRSVAKTDMSPPEDRPSSQEEQAVQRTWPDLETRYARLLDHTFARAKQEGRLASVVVVGAMDGRRFDALYPYLSKGLAKAILIEPIPDRFELLKQTFADQTTLIFENCAIDATAGSRKMLHIPLDAVAGSGLPEDVIGMSSFYDDRNGLGGVGSTAPMFDTIEANRQWIEVPTAPLSDILRKHGVGEVDILQIDTEGHDLHVLKSLDMDEAKPETVLMEYYNLSAPERVELLGMLVARGYIYGEARKDICATLHRLPFRETPWIEKTLARFRRSARKRRASLAARFKGR